MSVSLTPASVHGVSQPRPASILPPTSQNTHMESAETGMTGKITTLLRLSLFVFFFFIHFYIYLLCFFVYNSTYVLPAFVSSILLISHLIILFFILILVSVHSVPQCKQCSALNTCIDCLRTFQCGWCGDYDNPTIGK